MAPDPGFEVPDQAMDAFRHRPPLPSQRYPDRPAVLRIGLPDQEPAVREPLQHAGHGGGPDAERAEDLHDRAGRVRPEIGEQMPFRRTHPQRRALRLEVEGDLADRPVNRGEILKRHAAPASGAGPIHTKAYITLSYYRPSVKSGAAMTSRSMVGNQKT